MSEMIPVVVFAYRRPDLLRRALESLRINDVPFIYAFSDGPRDASVAADVAEVREVLRAVAWTRTEIVEAPRNLGVATSQLQGITSVLNRHEMAVMVEEDLEFVPGTYAFICAALRHYRTEPKAMGVTAWTHPRLTPRGVTQPYFTGRNSGLMWGTWRRAWDGMLDANSAQRRAECEAQGIDVSRFGDDLASIPANDEALGMWDFRFNLQMLSRRGLFLFPATSMVRHTGYDPRATNSAIGDGWEVIPSPAPPMETILWPRVEELPGSGKLWRAAVNAPPPPNIVRRILRRLKRDLTR